MSEEKIAIVADTGCDIPADLAKEYGITMLPLHVYYPEKEYFDDVDIDPMMVYDRFPDEIPKTSTPTIDEIKCLYGKLKEEGYTHIISVAISSKFSGTYNAMKLAADYIEGVEFFVFDTKNISCGSGIFAYWAARMIKEKGLSFKEVTEGMQKKIRDPYLIYYMDTLTYLQKGGRIGKVSSMVGNILKLKPLISCNEDGEYYVAGKARGTKQANRLLIDDMVEHAGDKHVWVTVMEGKAHDMLLHSVEELKARITDMELIYTKQISATMAINTGPGLIGIMVFDPSLPV